MAMRIAHAAEQPSPAAPLLRAYPEFITAIEGNELVWNDGTRMQIDDGKAHKPFEAMLNDPDNKDMFALRYPWGADAATPPNSPN